MAEKGHSKSSSLKAIIKLDKIDQNSHVALWISTRGIPQWEQYLCLKARNLGNNSENLWHSPLKLLPFSPPSSQQRASTSVENFLCSGSGAVSSTHTWQPRRFKWKSPRQKIRRANSSSRLRLPVVVGQIYPWLKLHACSLEIREDPIQPHTPGQPLSCAWVQRWEGIQQKVNHRKHMKMAWILSVLLLSAASKMSPSDPHFLGSLCDPHFGWGLHIVAHF